MKELKLNDMRELNFNEIEEVSGGWFGFSFRLFRYSSDVGLGSDIVPTIRSNWWAPLNYNTYNNFSFA